MTRLVLLCSTALNLTQIHWLLGSPNCPRSETFLDPVFRPLFSYIFNGRPNPSVTRFGDGTDNFTFWPIGWLDAHFFVSIQIHYQLCLLSSNGWGLGLLFALLHYLLAYMSSLSSSVLRNYPTAAKPWFECSGLFGWRFGFDHLRFCNASDFTSLSLLPFLESIRVRSPMLSQQEGSVSVFEGPRAVVECCRRLSEAHRAIINGTPIKVGIRSICLQNHPIPGFPCNQLPYCNIY